MWATGLPKIEKTSLEIIQQVIGLTHYTTHGIGSKVIVLVLPAGGVGEEAGDPVVEVGQVR